MTEQAKPSLMRIVQLDLLALFGILVPVVALVMYVAVAYFGFFPGLRGRDPIQGTAGAPIFLYLFLAGVVIGLPLAYWRIRAIQQMFAQGAEVAGQITGVAFYRDRGRVEYTYTYQGKPYAARNAIMKTSATKQLRTGQQVVVLVSPDRPQHAVIRDLYI